MDYHHRDYVLNGIDSSRRALGDEAVVREALWRFAEVEQYSVVPYDHDRLRRATISAVPLIDLGDNQPILSALSPLVDTLTARIPRSMLREPERPPKSESGPVHSVRHLVEKVKKLAPLR
jgi:hypothetical protein